VLVLQDPAALAFRAVRWSVKENIAHRCVYFEWQPLSVRHCVGVGDALLAVLFGAEFEPSPLVLRGVVESVTCTTASRSVLVSSPPVGSDHISVSVVNTTACLSASGRRV
jgi:hypothetical protein